MILKHYAYIIRLRNLDPAYGLCNGTRLTLRSVTNRLIDAEVATGSHVGTRVFIPRIPLLTPPDSGFPFILKRRQFQSGLLSVSQSIRVRVRAWTLGAFIYILLKPSLAMVNFMWLSAEFRIRKE